MKKRILCFMTAAVLILLPWNAPAELCEDGHADPADYYVVGAREPTETEPGYSGDFYCPVCKTLMVRGWKIDPLPPSGGNAQTGQPAVQSPGNDSQEENPEAPVLPPSSGNEQTGQPDSRPSGNNSQEKNPEIPVLPPAPSEPEKEPEPDEHLPEIPPVNPEPEPKAGQKQKSDQKQQAKTNPKPAGSTSGKKSGREHFSKDYPFRRVRMNPEPGICAPAAGELIWPKASTPMQKMLRGD